MFRFNTEFSGRNCKVSAVFCMAIESSQSVLSVFLLTLHKKVVNYLKYSGNGAVKITCRI